MAMDHVGPYSADGLLALVACNSEFASGNAT